MKKKRNYKKIVIVISIVFVLLIVQTLPVFFLKPWGSVTLEDNFINLTYQPGDEKGAMEVFELLKEKSASIYSKMDYSRKDPIDVYIYNSQTSLAIREAGLLTLTFAPSWYIGDSHNGNIMMVSPYTAVQSHTHDSILTATLHELVHSITFRINPELSYFWDNGLATYLAEQVPMTGDYDLNNIPSMEDMLTEDGLKFGNMGGYAYSYFYIEYLDKTYGWDQVVAYAKGDGDYESVFNKTEAEIYADWCEHLKSIQ